MFCMGCGAETPARAMACPICGRAITGHGERDVRREAEISFTATDLAEAGVRSRGPLALSARGAATPATATGLPQDAVGLTLLLTTAAMVLDLFAPWSVVYGVRQSMAHVGAPAIILALLIAVAALPLARPTLRRQPLAAVCPLVVGSIAIGIALMYYVLLARENAQARALADVSSNAPLAATQGHAVLGPVITPDVGLYLFLLGGAVLVVAGYQLFLTAARAQPVAALATARTMPRTERNGAEGSAASHEGVQRTAERGVTISATQSESSTTALDPLPAMPQVTPQPAVPLPGSAAWTETPKQPAFQRPSSQRGAWTHPVRRS